jgi:hypothetical protein
MTRPHGGGRPAEPPTYYELRVQGGLDSRWSAWFEGLRITLDELGQTTIAGPLADQAAPAWPARQDPRPGLPLLPVRQLDPDRPQ